ncbi:MAG: Lrp/AsnC family transcriptional regulator [Bacteroidetes bacterium]|nr:MAG: Lrp/AsnC family transcriptional regulator [Bacteroidota bacterium]
MDAIDKKILEILQTDAMKTAKEMAEELALTPTPIYERIRKLENSGYIRQYVALLDAEMLGKNIVVFMNIAIKEHQAEKRNEFVRQMEELDAVSELYHTSGSYDFLVKVRFNSIKDYKDFLVNEVAAIPNIADIDSQIVLEEIKYSTKLNLN